MPRGFYAKSALNDGNAKSTHNNRELEAKDLGKITAKGHTFNIDPITQRNIQIISKQDLQNKGYVNLQQALEQNPNISFYDNGFGQAIDMRGQGKDANRAVKILINQVPINLLDTLHGIAPYNQINIDDIQSIEIIPGGGSVVYGSGTRGGVVNIVTKKPSKDYQRIAYKFTSAEMLGLQGGSVSLGVGQKANDKLFLRGDMAISYTPSVRNTSGVAYDYCFPKDNTIADGSCVGTEGYSTEKQLKGKSYGDNSKSIYVAFGARYDISQRQNVDVNINYTRSYVVRPRERLTLSKIIPSAVNGTVIFFDEKELKKRRYSPDDESIYYTTNALQSSLNYKLNATQNLTFETLGFYQMSDLVYSDYEWLAKTDGIQSNTKMSQLGSNFANHGSGLHFKLKHHKAYKNLINTAIMGYDLDFLHSNRTNLATRTYSHGYFLQVHINSIGSKIANSLYMLDNLQISNWFDITLGGRYEVANYFITSDQRRTTGMPNDIETCPGAPGCYIKGAQHFKDYRQAYAFEITPSFSYSNDGSVYIKGEVGYISPSPYQMVDSAKMSTTFNVDLEPVYINNLKTEQHITGEMGLQQDYAINNVLKGGVSLVGFYTHTFNEIYIYDQEHQLGTARFGNLGATQRAGFSLDANQKFFDSRLRLSEGINYTYSKVLEVGLDSTSYDKDAQKLVLGLLKGQAVPFVPFLKASIKIEADFIKHKQFLLSGFWHNTYVSQSTTAFPASKRRYSNIMNKGGYFLVDLGLNTQYKNLNFNIGVKNVLDSLYATWQTYYIDDQPERAMYIPAFGRSYYAELKWKF